MKKLIVALLLLLIPSIAYSQTWKLSNERNVVVTEVGQQAYLMLMKNPNADQEWQFYYLGAHQKALLMAVYADGALISSCAKGVPPHPIKCIAQTTAAGNFVSVHVITDDVVQKLKSATTLKIEMVGELIGEVSFTMPTDGLAQSVGLIATPSQPKPNGETIRKMPVSNWEILQAPGGLVMSGVINNTRVEFYFSIDAAVEALAAGDKEYSGAGIVITPLQKDPAQFIGGGFGTLAPERVLYGMYHCIRVRNRCLEVNTMGVGFSFDELVNFQAGKTLFLLWKDKNGTIHQLQIPSSPQIREFVGAVMYITGRSTGV